MFLEYPLSGLVPAALVVVEGASDPYRALELPSADLHALRSLLGDNDKRRLHI
jgi:hypothetical protein